MSAPRVSVLVPTFDRANYLLEAVNSALSQTFNDLEVVIVDDGSTDNTAEVVRAVRDPRVQYIYQPNRGVSGALNTAWRAARLYDTPICLKPTQEAMPRRNWLSPWPPALSISGK